MNDQDPKKQKWWNPKARWNVAFPKSSFFWLVAAIGLLWVGVDLSGRLAWNLKHARWEKQGVSFSADRHVREIDPTNDFLEAPIVKRWFGKDKAVLSAISWPGRFDPIVLSDYWNPTESDAQKILNLFASSEGILAQFREAAERPGISSLSPESLLETGGLPTNCMGFAEVTTTRARALLRLGRAQEAVDELIAGLRIAEHLGNLNAPASPYIRAGALSLFENAIRDGLARQSWEQDQLSALAGAIDRVHLTRGYAAAAVAQISHPSYDPKSFYPSANRFQLFREAGGALMELKGSSDPLREWGEVLENMLAGLFPRGFWDWQRTRVSTVAVENLIVEDGQIAPELTIEQVNRFSEESEKILRTIFHPQFYFFPQDIMETRQRYDFVRLAIALEQFALEQGEYPDRLVELVPDWLPEVPTDRFDPSRMIDYQQTEDGRYRLVSIGLDGIASGGSNDDHVWEFQD